LLLRKRQLSDFQRVVVIGLMQSGKSSQQIVNLLGEDEIKMSKIGVLRIINAYRQHETAGRKPGSDRPKKTTKRDCRTLKLIATRNRQKSLTIISSTFLTSDGNMLSRKTVSRRLRQERIRSFRCKKVSLISQANKAKRLNEAKTHENLNCEHIIWSDEFRFCWISDRPQRCLRRSNEAYLSQCTTKTVKKCNGIWYGVALQNIELV